MKSVLYLGFLRNTKLSIHIRKRDIVNGYIKIKCLDCNGTGIFTLPNGEIEVVYNKYNPCPTITEQCVVCKGSGMVYVNC